MRVLLVDNRPVSRECIHSVLEAERDTEVVAEAVEMEEALPYLESLNPDAVVNSHEALALQRRLPSVRLVISEAPSELSQFREIVSEVIGGHCE